MSEKPEFVDEPRLRETLRETCAPMYDQILSLIAS
jgi:hypothetical protein